MYAVLVLGDRRPKGGRVSEFLGSRGAWLCVCTVVVWMLVCSDKTGPRVCLAACEESHRQGLGSSSGRGRALLSSVGGAIRVIRDDGNAYAVLGGFCSKLRARPRLGEGEKAPWTEYASRG